MLGKSSLSTRPNCCCDDIRNVGNWVVALGTGERRELFSFLAARGLFFVAPLHFTANVRDHVGARGF
jgi:hypothetical protein